MQRVFYHFLRTYIWAGLHFYFKRIVVRGRSGIPSGPVIFAPNHQNAFMDALLVVCFNSHFTHFLARADIFKKPGVRWILSLLNLIPVYRIRDGWQSLRNNEQTFDACYNLFRKGEAVVIFPEGNHGSQRRLRPLSKGFTRVAFEAIHKDSSLRINIVPVGLNYANPGNFRSEVSILFGTPIAIAEYLTGDVIADARRLRADVSERLKHLITHIDDKSRYDEIVRRLDLTQPNYLDPEETNRKIELLETETDFSPSKQQPAPSGIYPLFYGWWLVINFLPLLLWRKIKSGIADPVFLTSVRFGVGIFLFPLFYILVGALLFLMTGPGWMAGWLVVAFTSPFVPRRQFPFA